MNNQFSFYRVKLLFFRFWAEKKYTLIVPTIAMALIFMLLNTILIGKQIEQLSPEWIFPFIFAKFVFLVILVYHIYVAFSSGSGSVHLRFLHLIPATTSEKFVFLIFTGTILPLIIYLIIFSFLNTAFALTLNTGTLSFVRFLFSEFALFGQESAIDSIMLPIQLGAILTYYFLFHFFAWGLIAFKEYAILKVFAISYLSLIAFQLVALKLFNVITVWNKTSLIEYAEKNPAEMPFYYWSFFLLGFVLLTFLFLVSFQKFKRKEIKA